MVRARASEAPEPEELTSSERLRRGRGLGRQRRRAACPSELSEIAHLRRLRGLCVRPVRTLVRTLGRSAICAIVGEE